MKTSLRFRFGIKKLDGLRARDIFLQKCVELGVARADAVKTVAGVFAKPVRRRKEQRDGDKRDERELPVEPEHYPDDRENNRPDRRAHRSRPT